VLNHPPTLSPGDSIAIVAPASPPRDQTTYEKGVSRLRETYDVRICWRPGDERGYLAAPDADRTAALHSAIRADDISAIFCVRGGYGGLRLLPHLDWTLARRHPTLLVGYSDTTALHLAFYTHARWPGLSGPIVTEWEKADAATLNSFQAQSSGEATDLTAGFDDDVLQPMVAGTATGPLLGGNLSVLSRLIGTQYLPNFKGAILVLEDVAEPPYRVDRMLAHLQHAGILDAVAGVVLGHFSTGDLDPDSPTLALETVFDDYLGARSYPVVKGLPYGHLLPRCTLPIGLPLRVKASGDRASLDMLSGIGAG